MGIMDVKIVMQNFMKGLVFSVFEYIKLNASSYDKLIFVEL